MQLFYTKVYSCIEGYDISVTSCTLYHVIWRKSRAIFIFFSCWLRRRCKRAIRAALCQADPGDDVARRRRGRVILRLILAEISRKIELGIVWGFGGAVMVHRNYADAQDIGHWHKVIIILFHSCQMEKMYLQTFFVYGKFFSYTNWKKVKYIFNW